MPRIVISEPEKEDQAYRFDVDYKKIRVGRGSKNDIILKDVSASSCHCEIERVSGGFILKDCDSTNGVWIDEMLFEVIDLTDGAKVGIGKKIECQFSLSEEEHSVLEKEEFKSHQRSKLPKLKSSKEGEDKKVEGKESGAENQEGEGEGEAEDKKSEQGDRGKSQKKRKSLAAPSSDTSFNKSREADSSKPVKLLATIVFVLLAIVLFLVGMCIRNFQENGTFLFG